MKSRVALAIASQEFTSEMLYKRILLLLPLVMIIAGPLCLGQQAVLFKRYDRGGAVNTIIEDTFSLRIDVKPEDKAIVGVRVCSKDPLPFGLVTASADPFFIAEHLVNTYAYTPERLVFLRSEDCVDKDASRGITEIWTLPQGASLPSHIEKVAFIDARRIALGKKPAFRGVRDYRQALAALIKELQLNPAARGLVVGYYAKSGRVTPMLRRRLNEVTITLKRSGLPSDRYRVYIAHWNDETWESEPNPQFPEVYIIKKAD